METLVKERPAVVYGNQKLASSEETWTADYLREHYLEQTNHNSTLVHPRNTIYTRYIKRLLDIAISLPVFCVLLPFNVLFGICTFFDVGRPIFFKQTRVGMNEKPFTMVKFRNMNEKKDADGNLLPPSHRVTRFGKIMRKLSFDEFLNFWSVLKGDMSIIGPRPQPVFIHERMSERHKMRSAVRPGLECPRLIHVPKEELFKYHRTFENDIWYVENVSFLLDVKMILALVKMVFSFGKRGDQAQGKGITYFVGYNEKGQAMSLKNYRELAKEGKYPAYDEHIKPVVLVTAIGTAASTAIISQLRGSGNYHIIGGDIFLKNQVATSKDVDEFFTFPSAIQDLDGYIDFVVDFCREHKVSYYFATIDEEIVNISSHRARFEEIGVKLCIPNHDLIMICHYKNRFCQWIDEYLPELSIRQYPHFADVSEYPVFMKPVEGRGSIGCRKVASREEAEGLLNNGLKERDYLIQEYQDGEIITVDLVRNAKTGQMQQIQRIEHLRNSSGCGIAVEIIDHPTLRDLCCRLMEKLDLNGVVNMEVFHKQTVEGDRFSVIEINPRFGAGTSFTCLAGCDIVSAAISIANEEPCKLGMPAIGAHLAKRYETYLLDCSKPKLSAVRV